MSQCQYLTSDNKQCLRNANLKSNNKFCWQHCKLPTFKNNLIVSDLDPVTQRFVDKLNESKDPPIYTMTPFSARETLKKLQIGYPNMSPVNINKVILPVGPFGKVHVHIIKPNKQTHDKLPVVMYFHGGGWVMGGFDTHERMIREICVGANVAIVFVDYTLSPEAQYPVPIQEAYEATKYIVQNSDLFSLDINRLAVMGDSVGGNMATVVAMLAKENKAFKIRIQILLYPVTNSKFNTKSYDKFAKGPWLTKKSMQWFWDNYLPDINKRNHRHVSPLLSSLDQLKDMPSTLLVVDENDVLRDEGEAYGNRLSQAGVYVERIRYLGTMHDFAMLNGIADSPATRAVILQVIITLKTKLLTTF